MRKKETEQLLDMALSAVHELETEQGILASGRSEIFGCIFGRDSLLVSILLLKAYQRSGNLYFLSLTRKILANLANLQGSSYNIESGEAPGKIIHEYRPTGHEHLTTRAENAWYVYDDGIMRIYDSVDSTPLFLIALNNYLEASGDEETAAQLLPAARAALSYLLADADSNADGLIDYAFPLDRKHGGLKVQNWMDSVESLFHEDGSAPQYPIAPVEVQAYAYSALKMWEERLRGSDTDFADRLHKKADSLKIAFNRHFVLGTKPNLSLASAIDGTGRPVEAVRSSIGQILWPAWKHPESGALVCILDEQYIPLLAKRLMKNDLFEPKAGIRTLSSASSRFKMPSYHNGSIWPHDSALIAEGLEAFGFFTEARKVRKALLSAMSAVGTPAELLSIEAGLPVRGSAENGQLACTVQAWSAAAIIAESYAAIRKKARISSTESASSTDAGLEPAEKLAEPVTSATTKSRTNPAEAGASKIAS